MNIKELRKRYTMAMRVCDCCDVRKANSAHRQACEIGYMLHDAGIGGPVDIPEDTERNFDAADADGITTITLPDGYFPEDLTRRRWSK